MDWIILIIGLIVLIYMAFVIKEEKSTAFVHGHDFQIGQFNIRVPTWWAVKTQSPLSFHRADTFYEWISKFTLLANQKDFDQEFLNWFESKNILMDEDSVVTENKEYLLKDQTTLNNIINFRRVEGTATQDREKRLYIDVIFLLSNNDDMLICESISSVLNGSLEGPYFEDVVKEIKFSLN